MKLITFACFACLLTGCDALWMVAYRHKGREPHHPKPPPSLPVAADQLQRLTNSSQPTFH